MNIGGVWGFRAARLLGRFVTTTAAILTLGQMPPFVSASAIIIDEDRILSVLDLIRGEPVLPGGHLKWRETPLVAVVREVREETGYTIGPGRLVGVAAGPQLAGESGIVRVIYEGAIQSGALLSSAEGEAVWLPLDAFVSRAGRDGPVVRDWLKERGADGAK
jgi:ADP-ribose pyrophosphatase YjhB (NUDIX family)